MRPYGLRRVPLRICLGALGNARGYVEWLERSGLLCEFDTALNLGILFPMARYRSTLLVLSLRLVAEMALARMRLHEDASNLSVSSARSPFLNFAGYLYSSRLL